MLYYLYHAVLYHTELDYTILYYTMAYHTMLHNMRLLGAQNFSFSPQEAGLLLRGAARSAAPKPLVKGERSGEHGMIWHGIVWYAIVYYGIV